MPAALVRDSYALLALLRDEAGGEAVARLLEHAGEADQPLQMTEANYAEVKYIIRRKDGDAAWEAVARELSAAPIPRLTRRSLRAGLLTMFGVRDGDSFDRIPRMNWMSGWRRKAEISGIA